MNIKINKTYFWDILILEEIVNSRLEVGSSPVLREKGN